MSVNSRDAGMAPDSCPANSGRTYAIITASIPSNTPPIKKFLPKVVPIFFQETSLMLVSLYTSKYFRCNGLFPFLVLLESMFQRQKELKDFDQEKISGEIAVVLGVGGIGTNVSIGLCRLGLQRMVLIDKDIVEAHNLNRQQLYAVADVGKKKVEAARDALLHHHNLCTEIEAYHMDALSEWGAVVKLCKEATVVFNTIDHGDKWDYAVGALCHALQIPCFLGGTEPWYGHLMSTFCQIPNEPCYACVHDLPSPPLDAKKILDYTDISFLPADPQPDQGGSTTYSACMCSQLLLSQYGTHRMQQDGYVLKHSIIVRLINMEMDTFINEKKVNCTICGSC